MVYITTAPAAQFVPETKTPDTKAVGSPNLEATLKAALEHARRMTQMFSIEAPEVAIAWETVEELQSAKARKTYSHSVTPKAAFARYCEANPAALEARIYDC
ncbi:MAG: CP12 domain-containing protein [Elainellaceae cyanobacterium]